MASRVIPTAQSSLRSILTGQLRGELPMRVVSGRMGRETVHFQALPNTQLIGEMNAFLNEFNHPTTPTDGLIRAGIAHLWFITIHPFEDGNGRIARALTDMALAQDDGQTMRLFSLSTQILKQRNEYYAILDTTQRGDLDISAWLLWFLQQIQAAANQAQKTIANTLVKARFWLRHQQTQLNPRQRKIINHMLDAQNDFEGGINTRKHISLTSVSRATAYRLPIDLFDKKCLKSIDKAGRSSGYELLYLG